MNVDLAIRRGARQLRESLTLKPGTGISFCGHGKIPKEVRLSGFSSTKSTGKWACQTSAHLRFLVNRSQWRKGVLLRLKCLPFSPRNQAIHASFWAQGKKVRSFVVRGKRLRELQFSFPLPLQPAQQDVHCEWRIDRPASEPGTEDDARPGFDFQVLAFRAQRPSPFSLPGLTLSRLFRKKEKPEKLVFPGGDIERDTEPTKPISPGTRFSLTLADPPAEPIRLLGFHPREIRGRWTAQPGAVLKFVVNPAQWNGALLLRFHCLPLSGPDYVSRASLWAGESKVADLSFSKDGAGWQLITARIPLPPSTAPRQVIRCEWRSENLVSPFDLGLSDDQRLLGLQIGSLEFRRP